MSQVMSATESEAGTKMSMKVHLNLTGMKGSIKLKIVDKMGFENSNLKKDNDRAHTGDLISALAVFIVGKTYMYNWVTTGATTTRTSPWTSFWPPTTRARSS